MLPSLPSLPTLPNLPPTLLSPPVLAVSVAFFLLLLFILHHVFWVEWRRNGEAPVARSSIPFLGHAFEFGASLPKFLSKYNHLGNVFTALVAGQRMTFLTSPGDTRALSTPFLSFRSVTDEFGKKTFGYSPMSDTLDEGTHDGYATHLLRAKGLTKDILHRYKPLLATLKPTTPLYRAVFDLVCGTSVPAIFGKGVWNKEGADAFAAFDDAFPLLSAGTPRWACGVQEAYDTLLRLLEPKPEEASAWIEERDVMFRKEEPEERSARQLSLLWASLANTIPAVYWTLAHILADPRLRERVQKEVDEVMEGKEVDVEMLDKMPVLDACFTESLRLYVVAMTLRRALSDGVLRVGEKRDQSVAVRKGDLVVLTPCSYHYSPLHFPHPTTFNPDRHLDTRGNHVPKIRNIFGAGRSMCPGRNLARGECKLLVVLLLTSFHIELIGDIPKPDFGRSGFGSLPPIDTDALKIKITPK